MKQVSTELNVYDDRQKKIVATVILNGYNIEAGGPLGQLGMMRSFSIQSGDLADQGSIQQILQLRDPQGWEAPIRVAALPVEEDGYGLIEFR